ncbi:MAG: membrane-bound metal-dependent hydrolase YbcI (DUF457 family) [Candidatus Nitrosomirales archaeon]|jgi:membrane-bound metal-dependent hydrolase YbcI (DUF457 family)
MCWGYLTGKASSSLLRVNANPYLLMFLAALPDIDLLLGIVGINHRTWTHSILLWSVVFVPFFVIYRKRSVPYFIAPIQHIIFGDAIVGAWNRPFYPLSHFNFALGYSLFSIEVVALEAAGLAIFLLLTLATKRARISFFVNSNRKVLAVLPLVLVAGFVLFILSYSAISDLFVDWGILREDRLLDTVPIAVQHPLFPYVLAMHLILIGILSASLLLSLNKKTSSTIKEPQDSRHR